MQNLHTLTLKQYLDGVSSKQFSASEVATAVEQEIAKHNASLNIYLTMDKEFSARAGHPDGALLAAPIAVKDNFCTKHVRTTASSTVLDTFIPQYDATVIDRLKHAGMNMIGKTNMDAWAHGSSTETSQYGRTLNPRNLAHLPGGSSGGSAAAVAANLCIASIGSETAGSIRQPSAWCGTVGLKPTYGRTSRFGVVAMGSSLDCPGPITKTVEDSAILLNHIAGQDAYDGTTSPQTVPDFTQYLDQSIKGLRIGVLYHDHEGLRDMIPLLDQQLSVFETLGAEVQHADAMNPDHAIGVYTVVQRGEVSSNLARYDGIRYGNDRSFFGDEAKRRIMLGTYTLSKGYADQYYNRAQQVRTLFIKDFERLFQRFDVLISLTSPRYAAKIGATEGAAMFGELEDLLVEPSSISGLPGINVPCYHDPKTNLYLGMNIMAPMWREDLAITVADAFEKNTTWNEWRKQQRI